MTFCENCKCHLGSNRMIAEHLESNHGVHVRMGEDSHLAYCNDCHKYLGKKKSGMQHFVDCRMALEKHLEKHHQVKMHEGCLE
jgi:hypothetical protein